MIMKRSRIMTAVVALAAFLMTACGQGKEPKMLVVYYSHSGYTEALAEQVQQITGADIYEITLADPYPADVEETIAVWRQEVQDGTERALAGQLPDISAYDVIFVGTPVWGGSYATPVGTLFDQVSVAGKTVVPFATYNTAVGDCIERTTELCSAGTVLQGFSAKNTNVAGSKELVEAWIASLALK